MRRFLTAILAALALASTSPALASQAGGCLPTTGTYTGLTAAGYINAGFTSLFSANSGASPPANPCGGNPLPGQLWLNTSSGTVQPFSVYDGTQWLTMGTLDVTGHTWQFPPFPTQLLAADGTLSNPGISFTSDPNTGIRHVGDGAFDLVSNGVAVANITAGGVNIPSFSGLNLGQVRLDKVGANLTLIPWDGNQLTIDSINRTVPAGGVSLAPGVLAVGQVYYIYAFMVGPNIALEASTQSHIPNSSGLHVKSGDASRTLVGMARTGVGPSWVDIPSQRLVASWFNRRPRWMYSQDCCGNVTVSQQVPGVFDANAIVYFVSWGGLATQGSVTVPYDLPDNGSTINYAMYTAVHFDGTQTASWGYGYWYVPVSNIGNLFITSYHNGTWEFAEGFHYFGPVAWVAASFATAINTITTTGTVWQ